MESLSKSQILSNGKSGSVFFMIQKILDFFSQTTNNEKDHFCIIDT